jgi:hypothetical protein
MWQKWTKPNKPWAHMKLPASKKDKALFAAATTITLGDGSKAMFWSDRWLMGQIPAEIAPDLFKISTMKNRTVKEALENEKWLLDLRLHLDTEHLPQLFSLAQLIESVQLTDEPDHIAWKFGGNQTYSAKSAYMLQFLGAVGTDFKKLIWRGWAPARCKFFIWTLMLDRVLTADKLLQRGWENDYFCPLCRRNLETASHIFTECPFSIKVWENMAGSLGLGVLKPARWKGKDIPLQDWYRDMISAQPKSQRKIIFPAANLICWEIWKERNRRIFEKKELPVADFIVRLKEEAAAWKLAGAPIPLALQYGGAPFDPG